jgi:hypothetical protein
LFYYEQNKSVKENKMSSTQPIQEPRGLLNWWQGLILAASSALIGVVAALFILKGGGTGAPAGPGWAMQLLRFIPHFLMLFGILADAFTYEGVYWTGTAVGITSTFVAPFISGAVANLIGALRDRMAAKGGAIPGEYPGLSMLSMNSELSSTPETLIVTASILSYYIFDLIVNLSVLDAAGAIVAASILFGGQAFAIEGGADKAAYSGILGVVIGGSCFGILSSIAPSYLPSSVIPGSKAVSGSAATGPGRKGFGMSAGGGAAGAAGVIAQTNGNPAAPATCPA